MTMSADTIWTLVSFVLTLLVFSYWLGDNPLFRLTTYAFVGCVAGYVFVTVVYSVLIPRLVIPLFFGSMEERFLAVIPALLSVFLFFKLIPSFSQLGNVSMGYLVGVGAAITIGGAVLGTITSQVGSSINLFGLQTGDRVMRILEGIFMLIGTVSTLIYFQFSASQRTPQTVQRPLVVEGIAFIGQLFIVITLGALFAGALTAAITALIERLDFIVTVIFSFFIK